MQPITAADSALAESLGVVAVPPAIPPDSVANLADTATGAVGDPSFLQLVQTNAGGILVVFLVLAGLALLLQWVLWMFKRGRFSRVGSDTAKPPPALRYVFSEGLVKIIDDFRHFLALIIMLIFAGIIVYAMVKADTHAMRMDALKGVVAVLGGLVGSIIGYYFGESSVRIAAADPAAGGGGGGSDAVQGALPTSEAAVTDIESAPDPRGMGDAGEGDRSAEDDDTPDG